MKKNMRYFWAYPATPDPCGEWILCEHGGCRAMQRCALPPGHAGDHDPGVGTLVREHAPWSDAGDVPGDDSKDTA